MYVQGLQRGVGVLGQSLAYFFQFMHAQGLQCPTCSHQSYNLYFNSCMHEDCNACATCHVLRRPILIHACARIATCPVRCSGFCRILIYACARIATSVFLIKRCTGDILIHACARIVPGGAYFGQCSILIHACARIATSSASTRTPCPYLF